MAEAGGKSNSPRRLRTCGPDASGRSWSEHRADRIAGEVPVGGHEGEVLDQGLGGQDAVEGIALDQGERGHPPGNVPR